ncbi:hypothetical protein [Algibacter sp. L4_22]|uniref:hypothetical protein n=1 Tax=Algibacter sp. L4_22 TaxID=2942477 RepID=UPI00201B68DC|nr:hypothetical protein [Algibacter sp. L4_22]MCL5129597.1 hypothetical protein [Algibacter sp. L4_22]
MPFIKQHETINKNTNKKDSDPIEAFFNCDIQQLPTYSYSCLLFKKVIHIKTAATHLKNNSTKQFILEIRSNNQIKTLS